MKNAYVHTYIHAYIHEHIDKERERAYNFNRFFTEPLEKRFSEFFGIYEINLVLRISHHTQ